MPRGTSQGVYRFPYEKYADGQEHLIRRGIDFPATSTTRTLQICFIQWAKRKGVVLTCNRLNEEEILVRIADVPQAGIRLPDFTRDLNRLKQRIQDFCTKHFPTNPQVLQAAIDGLHDAIHKETEQ
jgi:hypothetical protein